MAIKKKTKSKIPPGKAAISLLVNTDLKEAWQALADSEKRSLNSAIELLMEEHRPSNAMQSTSKNKG